MPAEYFMVSYSHGRKLSKKSYSERTDTPMNDPHHQIKSCSVSIYGMHLDYILHETSENNRPVYSITIRKETAGSTEEACAYDITSIRRRALELFHLVVSGTVTPCTLCDIMEDFL